MRELRDGAPSCTTATLRRRDSAEYLHRTCNRSRLSWRSRRVQQELPGGTGETPSAARPDPRARRLLRRVHRPLRGSLSRDTPRTAGHRGHPSTSQPLAAFGLSRQPCGFRGVVRRCCAAGERPSPEAVLYPTCTRAERCRAVVRPQSRLAPRKAASLVRARLARRWTSLALGPRSSDPSCRRTAPAMLISMDRISEHVGDRCRLAFRTRRHRASSAVSRSITTKRLHESSDDPLARLDANA